MLEFLAGKPVQIRDMFRLGKNNRSTASDKSCPRPIFIKLSMAWDRKLVFLRKRNLREFRIKRLFIQEDLPPEIQQQNSSRVRTEKTSARSPGNKLFVPTSPSSALAQSQREQSSDLMVDVAQKSDTVSWRSRRDLSQSRNLAMQEKLLKCKIASKFAQKKKSSFWSTVKSLNRRSAGQADTVDGISGDHGIANLFASKLENILNIHPSVSRAQ